MALVIDANMKLFADRVGITSSRMIRDYGLSTVDEIIEAEAERGNSKALDYVGHAYHSPERLIKLFELTNVENRYVLLHKMDENTRLLLLPKLDHHDLVMGLNFFTQEMLLKMMEKVNIIELVRVVQETYSLEHIMMMFKEEDLAKFFLRDEIQKEALSEYLRTMPQEIMQKFVEGITGRPMEETNPLELIRSIESLPDKEYRKFMAQIDPDVQRHLALRLAKDDPSYLTLFENKAYIDMLSKLMKPDMIKPMIVLSQETLVGMISQLPPDLMSICAAQIDPRELAKFLQKGHMDLIEDAWMV